MMTDQYRELGNDQRSAGNCQKFEPGEIPIVPEGWSVYETFGGPTFVVKNQDD